MKTYYYVETGEIIGSRAYFKSEEKALEFQKEWDGDIVSFKANIQDLKGIVFVDD